MRTFIVRLQHEGGDGNRPGAEAPPPRGVVDEVATGLRATFRNDTELLTALTTALAAAPPRARDGRAPHESSPD